MITEAWVLQGIAREAGTDSELQCERIELDALASGDVLVEPLFGSWEANMSHAIARSPVDVCRQRGEGSVVLGNCGVVRVLDVGQSGIDLRPGDECVFLGTGRPDKFGYMELAHAYDCPRTVGLLAKHTKVFAHNLFPIPKNTRFSLRQWAVFSGKYITAWSNWRMAYGALRLQLSECDLPCPRVWGWGGGTTLAELDLAKRHSCSSTMISGSDWNAQQIAALGIDIVDRRQFPALAYNEARFSTDATYREAYRDAERAFLDEVQRRTGGRGVSIFIDYIGEPVFRASLRALSRQGVLATAGWKHGMATALIRATECIQRHTHVHTHYARLTEAEDAIQYGESVGWMPPEPLVYSWDDVPRLAKDYSTGNVRSYFSVFSVNPA